MSDITKILLTETGQELIVDEDFPQELSFSYQDVRDLAVRSASRSKNLKVRGTKEHNKIFSNLYDAQIDAQVATFDLKAKHPCQVIRNGFEIFEGWLQLDEINVDTTSDSNNKNISYDITVYDQSADFYNRIGENQISSLDFSKWDHTLDFTAVTHSWTATTDDLPYYYPVVNNTDDDKIVTKNFKPSFYAKALTDSIFEDIGMSYNSDFFTSDRYKNFVIPFSSSEGNPTISQDETDRRSFVAGISAGTEMLSLEDYSIGQSIRKSEIGLNVIDYNKEISDGDDVYDPTASPGRFTSPGVGKYNFKVKLNVDIVITNNTGNNLISVQEPDRLQIVLMLRRGNPATSWKPKELVTVEDVLPNPIPTGVTIINTTFETTDDQFANISVNGNQQAWIDLDAVSFVARYQGEDSVFNRLVDLTISSTTSSASVFENEPQKTDIDEFGNIALNEYLPGEMKYKDYFINQVKMFNLMFVPVKGKTDEIKVETFDDFYNSGDVINLDDINEDIKIDYSKPYTIKHAPELVNKEILFTYSEDKGKALDTYRDTLKREYGQQRTTFPVEYLTKKDEVKPTFAATPTVNSDGALKFLCPDIDSLNPKNKYRFLNKVSYPHSATTLSESGFNKLTEVNITEAIAYNYRSLPTEAQTDSTFNIYTIYSAHHFDDVLSPKFDLNYGQNPYYLYNSFSAITQNNLFNVYWSNKINQIPNQKIFNCRVFIPLHRIKDFQFNELFLFEGESWIINKISAYDIKTQIAKCEFLSYERSTPYVGNQNQPELRLQSGELFRRSGKDFLNFGDENYQVNNNLLLGNNNSLGSGKNNIIFGDENNVSGDYNHIAGTDNNSAGSFNTISGSGNTVNKDSVIVFGQNNIVSADSKTAIIVGNANSGTTINDDGSISSTTISADTVFVASGVTAEFISGNTISGNTIYSGSTDLGDLFALAGETGDSPFSGNSITGSIAPLSGSNDASGSFSFVGGGSGNVASGNRSHASGYYTTASGAYSNAEGASTSATTNGSHAEGGSTLASGAYSHAEGNVTTASGDRSHAEGRNTIASGAYSHAQGNDTMASGGRSHAEGQGTIASGAYSHAEGLSTSATGSSAHAEGWDTIASGDRSHAEGVNTTASANNSHSEGSYTTASGAQSHAEGFQTTASANNSHAEGQNTTAAGAFGPHSGGYQSSASGDSAFVHSFQSDVGSENAAILGGRNNRINIQAARSVILGGQNITADTANTVYVPSFALTDPNPIPTTSGDTGTKGTISYDDDYLYVCFATDQWMRFVRAAF